MCGLAGIISNKGVKPAVLSAMGHKLHHRGPDGSGVLFYSTKDGARIGFNGQEPDKKSDLVAGFIHLRLKVIDLSDSARQPMGDSNTALIFNGEIYNYRELRRELESEGEVFTSSGDTEVVLKAFAAWGTDCFSRFQGMWALAILDGQNNRVVLSRDRFGIKPLYYTRLDGDFYFASEIKALLAVPGVRRTPDPRTMARYIGLGILDDSDNTFFEDIQSFPAGHWGDISLESENKGIRPHRYWSLRDDRFDGSFEDAVRGLREIFAASIKGHYHSDVPSGNCLSGGLDSSSIVCMAGAMRGVEDFTNHTGKGFGYVPADGYLSERTYMEAAAISSGIDLEVVSVDEKAFARAMPEILSAYDEPVGSASACAQWFVFRQAAKAGIRVMIDGQGADESFGGYQGYLSSISRNPIRVLADIILPPPFRSRLMKKDEIGVKAMTPALSRLAKYDMASDLAPRHDLRKTLATDLQSRILPALLRYEDVNSMAHSIEARVPFLDHKIVEFAFSLPDEWKISGDTQKLILRRAMKEYVPREVLERQDKIGFHAGKGRVSTFIRILGDGIIENATGYEQDWFDEKELAGLFEDSAMNDARERTLWRIINAKLWARSL